MAQTGFTPISNYYSATATNVPTAGNLVAGELAINTADGKLFYKDSSGVVQTLATKATTAGTYSSITTSNLTIGTTQLGAGNASIMKNRIINGAMVIDQRNAGASTSGTDGYTTLDRYRVTTNVGSKATFQQNAGSVTPPVGFNNYLGATSSSAYTVAAGDYYYIEQRIEGFNTADLGWGTASAKTVTLSFWVRSSLTGNFGASIVNASYNRSYLVNYSIPVANTWTQISVTIAGDTTGTWATGNSYGLAVQFSLGVGTTNSSTANSWLAGGYIQPTGSVSVVGTSGATFYITGVQLEVGSSATGFEYVNYQTSLANCQRYYQSLPFQAGYFAIGTATNTSSARGTQIKLDQVMRANPTIVLPASGSGAGQIYFNTPAGGTPATIGTTTALRANVDSFQIEGDAYTAAFVVGQSFSLSAGSGGITITASAEL